MVMSFKSYLIESTSGGNYVSIDVDANSVFPLRVKPSTGTETPPEKRHVTLIYSKQSRVNPKDVLSWLTLHCHQTIVAEADYYAAFDSIPKDGQRDDNLATLVVKLRSPVLQDIHEKLKAMGMEHSYPEFSPHVSLFYMVDREECHRLVDQLNSNPPEYSVVLSGYNSENINEDWAKSLK